MKPYKTEDCRATEDWPYAIAAGAVVFRIQNNTVEILLLKRAAGDFPFLRDGHIDTFHIPKGHMNFGDSLEQTALREVAEEAGCSVELQTYLGASLLSYNDHRNIRQEKVIHYFAGLWKEDTETMDQEHSDRMWVSIEEAIKLLGSDNPKREDEIIKRLKTFLELTGD